MVRCALCHVKVGDGPKYRKHTTGSRHQSNLAKKVDPSYVDTKAVGVSSRKLEALGLGKNRWITTDQYNVVLGLKRIQGTGIPLNCFELTGCKTKLGFCTDDDWQQAKVLHDARTIEISSTGLERARFCAIGIVGDLCSPEEHAAAAELKNRTTLSVPASFFSEEVDSTWCTPEQLQSATTKHWRTADWLPEGTFHPREEMLIVKKSSSTQSRPTSAQTRAPSGTDQMRISLTPTLGGALSTTDGDIEAIEDNTDDLTTTAGSTLS